MNHIESKNSNCDEKILQKLKQIKAEICNDGEESLSRAIDKLLNGLKMEKNGLNGKIQNENKKKKLSLGQNGKEFKLRNSVLTDLWCIQEIHAIYNICLAVLGLLIMNTIVFYSLEMHKIQEDFQKVLSSAGNFHIVVLVILAMHFAILFLLYPVINFWANIRQKTSRKGLYDFGIQTFCAVFLLLLFVLPLKTLFYFDLPTISSFIVLCEKVRLSMKSYAFIRETIPRVKGFKKDDDKYKKPCPTFSQLLYFLFAPTLVYRDEYPRTPSVNWHYVAWNFTEFFCCIFVTYIIFHRFMVDMLHSLVEGEFKGSELPVAFASYSLCGGAVMLCIFYGFLHCWLNAFAEMLRFGDRQFYQDWWNCTDFSSYYRKWNGVVHDWLFCYIYMDLSKLLKNNRTVALILVFIISAIIHEYILACSFRFCIPILMGLFLNFGLWVVFITKRKTYYLWNVFMWWALFTGWGFMCFMYCFEWYARTHCSHGLDTFLDVFVPRVLWCDMTNLKKDAHS